MTVFENEQLRIVKLDELNWAIQSKRVVQEWSGKGRKPKHSAIGETRWNTDGYFPTLAQAAKRASLMLTDAIDASSLMEYSKNLEAIVSSLVKAIKPST